MACVSFLCPSIVTVSVRQQTSALLLFFLQVSRVYSLYTLYSHSKNEEEGKKREKRAQPLTNRSVDLISGLTSAAAAALVVAPFSWLLRFSCVCVLPLFCNSVRTFLSSLSAHIPHSLLYDYDFWRATRGEREKTSRGSSKQAAAYRHYDGPFVLKAWRGGEGKGMFQTVSHSLASSVSLFSLFQRLTDN